MFYYAEPCARVRIGSDTDFLEFNSVNKIVIDESVKDLGNKATITLPRNYGKLDGQSLLDLLKTGDRVKIWLGYDGQLNQEFSGYLQEIESEAPLVLHVDDEFYLLKRNTLNKTWKSGVTLKQILQYVAPGYTINCPDVSIGSYQIPGVSSYRVLLAICEQYGFYSWISGKTFNCFWSYNISGSLTGNFSTYTFFTPTVKKSNLKYHRAEYVKLRVRVSSRQRNGKILKYETGREEKESMLKSVVLPAGMSMDFIKKVAEQNYKQSCFDGFSGSITGFGIPITRAGDTLRLVNSEEKDKEGNYLIESVKITYDVNSPLFDRENFLSFKV